MKIILHILNSSSSSYRYIYKCVAVSFAAALNPDRARLHFMLTGNVETYSLLFYVLSLTMTRRMNWVKYWCSYNLQSRLQLGLKITTVRYLPCIDFSPELDSKVAFYLLLTLTYVGYILVINSSYMYSIIIYTQIFHCFWHMTTLLICLFFFASRYLAYGLYRCNWLVKWVFLSFHMSLSIPPSDKGMSDY